MWANYDLVGATPITTIEELYGLYNGVVVFDELQATIHARRSQTNDSMAFGRWYDQVRKQDLEVFIISQQLRKVDVLVRDMADYVFDCRNMRAGGYLSEVEVYDWWDEAKVSNFVFDRRLAFDLYNHKQRAWPLLAPEPPPKARNGGKQARTPQSEFVDRFGAIVAK
jgi:hypothetical protein